MKYHTPIERVEQKMGSRRAAAQQHQQLANLWPTV
jgi:hypothetical protein